MSDKSDLKAELERKKQRLAQIREEKKRKEEERKKKEVGPGCCGVLREKENHSVPRRWLNGYRGPCERTRLQYLHKASGICILRTVRSLPSVVYGSGTA